MWPCLSSNGRFAFPKDTPVPKMDRTRRQQLLLECPTSGGKVSSLIHCFHGIWAIKALQSGDSVLGPDLHPEPTAV